MNRNVGEFEKVSFEQFYTDTKNGFYNGLDTPENKEDCRGKWEAIRLPRRATAGSAGYDVMSPFSFRLQPGETIKFPTGIRVRIDGGWWLACLPRSGLGFKYQIWLANTVGVIDEDYFFSDNEGHIFAKLVNGGDKPVEIHAGDSFMQAVFIPYGITYSDDADGVRNGGMGSTGK